MSTQLLIKNAHIITPSQPANWVSISNGKITGLGFGLPPLYTNDVRIIDAQGLTLIPGFIDLHVHGAVNHEAMDATSEALSHMANFYAQHGVTGFLATTWTDTRERITNALNTVADHIGRKAYGSTLLGAYLEGTYINAKKSGAQNTAHVRYAEKDEANEFLEYGVVKLVALAPEFEANHWLIETCVNQGITVSAAHTAATYEDICHAVTLGLSQSTHTFNAQTGLHHRAPGAIGAILTSPEIRCELIADNVHIHPAVMKLLYLAKGVNNIILISDAVRSAGMPDGEYPIDNRSINVREGIATLPDGTLAGSMLTMDRAMYNFMQATGESIETLWRISSLNAAQAIGIETQKGSIEISKDADLALIDRDINVHMTIAEGRIIYQKDSSYVSS